MLNPDTHTQKEKLSLKTICIENEYLNYKVFWVFNWTQEPGHLFYQIKGQQSVDQETLMRFMCPYPYLHSLLK